MATLKEAQRKNTEGIVGSLSKYLTPFSVLTITLQPAYTPAFQVESTSGATDILLTATTAVDTLDHATQGDADIYLLVSTLP